MFEYLQVPERTAKSAAYEECHKNREKGQG
jgi:hypothetical protein